MILSASAIEAAVRRGDVVIEPFAPERLNPNSYTFSVGKALYEVTAAPAPGGGYAYDWAPAALVDGAWVLQPGRLYLAATAERLGGRAFAARLSGRPQLGLAGLCVQVTADLGHQGAVHRWTLEFVAAIPTRLAPGQKVGQISFWGAHGAPAPYAGHFGGSDEPMRSRLHVDTAP